MKQILSVHFAKSSSRSSILFQGFRTWNSLLFDTENALSLSIFKRVTKPFLSYFFVKIPLSRHVGHVMDGSMRQ